MRTRTSPSGSWSSFSWVKAAEYGCVSVFVTSHVLNIWFQRLHKSLRNRCAPAPSAQQINGRAKFKQRIRGRLDSVQSRYRIEDDVFLLRERVRRHMGQFDRTQFHL